MAADAPTILGTSIGFGSRGTNSYDWLPGPVFDLAVELARPAGRPKICYLGTATGDDITRIGAFYAAFADRDVDVSHLALFAMPNVADVRAHLLSQDVIWVGGGSTANLLACWRVHQLDAIMRDGWESGVVLGGVSAGSICWHSGGTTDSWGPRLRPITDGIGLLPYSNGVHYDAEPQRRPLFQQLIGAGTLPTGYATDNGAGIRYRGAEFVEAFAESAGAYGYRVEPAGDGTATETRLATRLL